jgi:hypothetical protein
MFAWLKRKSSDELCGCDLDFRDGAVADDDLDSLVLFADVDPGDGAAVAARAAEWRQLGGHHAS